MGQWMLAFLTRQRSARLITNDQAPPKIDLVILEGDAARRVAAERT